MNCYRCTGRDSLCDSCMAGVEPKSMGFVEAFLPWLHNFFKPHATQCAGASCECAGSGFGPQDQVCHGRDV